MALEKAMKLANVEQFLLKGDMQDVLKYDVEPIMHLGDEPGGYFGVPRQLFSLIDFMGAAYTGKYKRGNASKGALKFIQEVMKEADPNYAVNGKIMYEMYRHGIVHFFQPKSFRLVAPYGNAPIGARIVWAAHKGVRKDDVIFKDGNKKKHPVKQAEHLTIRDHPFKKDTKILIISIRCLLDDFKKSLKKYFELLKNDESKYLSNWNDVANYISDYEDYPFHPQKKSLVERFMDWLRKGVGV